MAEDKKKTGWSYSGDPSQNDKDFVRFTIGDTDVDRPLLLDKEIQHLVTVHGSASQASIAGARALAAKFSRQSDETVGSVSKSFSQRAKAFLDLAKSLRSASNRNGVPYAGGISVGDKLSNIQDDDRVKPVFTKHMQDNPRRTEITDEDIDDRSSNN